MALEWIKKNSINNEGITITSKQKKIYPEVTGYYIPTLLQWGETDLAIRYAKKLCAIQKEDGSWNDPEDREPYIFDSAQILKGLICIKDVLPEVEEHIIKGCDWILSNMQEDGRLITPDENAWGDNGYCSELIHIYCLSPIKQAGEIYERKDYLDKVDKILNYYINNYKDKILDFSLLSHFYAYVLEGLIDLGRSDISSEAMHNIEKYQRFSGAIPGLKNVNWVCSTGLFQLALVWYKLGELKKGNKAFYYALSLQNKSGGWYGSYPSILGGKYLPIRKFKPGYFKDEEISWAVKYFLDALACKEKLEFDNMSNIFSNHIDRNDGRYVLVEKCVKEVSTNRYNVKVCDVGCGKGRYLLNLIPQFDGIDFFATDLSDKVMADIANGITIAPGRMTCLPFENQTFDLTYTCEAFEHAINLEGAIKELLRVTKVGGTVLIIDKPIEKQGRLKLYEWEQWINDKDIEKWASENKASLQIIESVPYEGCDDGLFRAWKLIKRD